MVPTMLFICLQQGCQTWSVRQKQGRSDPEAVAVQASPKLAPQGPQDIESGMPAIPEGHEGASPSSTDGLTAGPKTPRTPTQWKGNYKARTGPQKPTGPK